jgi:hypothetical protein
MPVKEEKPPVQRESGEFWIVSMEEIGPNLFRVTTESKKYGRVTQNVMIFTDPEDARKTSKVDCFDPTI